MSFERPTIHTGVATVLLMCMAMTVDARPALDTRVLVDVSGSMKKNDPGNQRREALQLLVELLPKASTAGVWTFAQYVNMQVKLGKVTRKWRQRARKAADEIHSRGLFTDIERALKTATDGWSGHSQDAGRNLILLTDGVVDVAKEPARNVASRQRIENELVPWLKQRSIRVHTVALSNHADHDLMRQLSRATGGRYLGANDASELKRIFFKLFETTAAPDLLPLRDNRFAVDAQVNEMTVLVFHPKAAPATRLRDPEGNILTAKTADDSLTWIAAADYDLITLNRPRPGAWLIQAASDPDNRVMVVSNLRLDVSPLPAYILPDAVPNLAATLVFEEKLARAAKLFDMVTVTLTKGQAPAVDPAIAFRDTTAAAAKGRRTFALAMTEPLPVGDHELIVRVNGRSFTREKRLQTHSGWPISTRTDAGEDGATRISLLADRSWIDSQSVHIAATLHSGSNPSQALAVTRTAADGWQAIVTPDDATAGGRVAIEVTATAHDGQVLNVDLPSVPIAETAPPADSAPEPEPKVAPAPAIETRNPEPDWLRAAAITLVVNLIAVAFAGGWWWWRRRRRVADEFGTLLEAPA